MQKSLLILLSLFLFSCAEKKSDKNFGISPETIALINSIKSCSKVVINLPGNPYSLLKFDGIETIDGIVLTYERNAYTLQKAAEIMFGGIDSPGRLPVSIVGKYKAGEGINLGTPIRMSYVSAEDIGMNSIYLQKVDSIVQQAIAEHATPGCQILAAKNGQVFYHKAFGNYFFFITGFHGFHVFTGILINIIIFLNVLVGTYEKRKSYEMVEKTGLYWHFVDLVWVFVFLAFYLL
jgi:hypothetical protein